MEKRLIDFDALRLMKTVCAKCDCEYMCFHIEPVSCDFWQKLEVPDINNMTEAIKYQKLPQVCDICGERFLWKESEHVCQDCNKVRK